MRYKRMAIEQESPEETGYSSILYNLAESSVTDFRFSDLNFSPGDLRLEYVPHRGHQGLRSLIAADAGLPSPEDVLLTHGAAGALFIVNTALLEKEDHLVVVRPNYSTNIQVPLTIGCAVTFIDLNFEENWRINVAAVMEACRDNTRLISITTPHNPTGMVMTAMELSAIATLARERAIPVLADETYRDAGFLTPYPPLATTYENVISVSSLSKAYGLPGLRMGWIITRDTALMEQFLAAKEMMYISNSALDEAVAYEFYQRKNNFGAIPRQQVMNNFSVLKAWLEREDRFDCVLPEGGVVCFPRLKKIPKQGMAAFHALLLEKFKTIVGPGHWFGMPDEYLRIGFGWADEAAFLGGLGNISQALSELL